MRNSYDFSNGEIGKYAGACYSIEAEVQWIYHRVNYDAPVRDVELLVADWHDYETQSRPFWRA